MEQAGVMFSVQVDVVELLAPHSAATAIESVVKAAQSLLGYDRRWRAFRSKSHRRNTPFASRLIGARIEPSTKSAPVVGDPGPVHEDVRAAGLGDAIGDRRGNGREPGFELAFETCGQGLRGADRIGAGDAAEVRALIGVGSKDAAFGLATDSTAATHSAASADPPTPPLPPIPASPPTPPLPPAPPLPHCPVEMYCAMHSCRSWMAQFSTQKRFASAN